MPLQLSGVHVYEKVPGTHAEMRLVRTNPYLRIAMKDHPPIYIQGGKFYSEGGPEVRDFPPGFEAELAKASPEARRDVGLGEPAHEAPPKSGPKKIVRMWTCPQATCGETMTASRKGVHIAAHRRVERAGSV